MALSKNAIYIAITLLVVYLAACTFAGTQDGRDASGWTFVFANAAVAVAILHLSRQSQGIVHVVTLLLGVGFAVLSLAYLAMRAFPMSLETPAFGDAL